VGIRERKNENIYVFNKNTCIGKLQNNVRAVIKKRKLLVKNGIILPVYDIQDLETKQVLLKFYF
jgi:hypothetical protein